MDIFGYNLHNESDCAEILELNDRFIRRYTDVMSRYGMLPGCGEVLYEEVKKEFPQRFIDYLDAVNCFIGFSYLAPPFRSEGIGYPERLGEMFEEEQDPGLSPDEQAKEDSRIMTDENSAWMDKLAALYRRMMETISRQVLDWCNIYGVGLSQNARQEGLQVLFLFGHLLGLIKTAMFASDYFANKMAIQLVDQGMKEVSRIELLIESMQKKMPMLASLFRGRRECVSDIRRLLQTYRAFCEKHDINLDEL